MRVSQVVLIISCALVGAVLADQEYVLSMDIVDQVNSNPSSTWKAGYNEFFAKWTVDKARSIMGALPTTEHTVPTLTYPQNVIESLPASFDARQQWPKCIGPILNQAECGSCWAFGCAEAVSDRLCISGKQKPFVQRAALDLVSCDYGFFNNGCQGGQLEAAWQYAQQFGLVNEGCAPYLKSEGGPIPTCPPDQQPCMPNTFVPTPKCNSTCADGDDWHSAKVKISSVYTVSSDASQIAAEIMTNGPVEAAFTVYADFVHYKSGVYSHQTGSALGGHAIKIIGWGTENGQDYWLVQNSWTTTWGDEGLFKIAKGVDECGIEDDVVAGTP